MLQAITGLAPRAKLRGLILDLRGNGGGSPAEVSQLLGAFIHSAAWSYDCNVHGSCTANYTDTSVPLLHLPLVVLTDRNCASACDAFSGAVKDLRLGTLVGTRTSGIAAAPRGRLPARRRQPSYLSGHTGAQRPPRAHQRHRRRAGLRHPAHRARPLHRARPRHHQSAHPARRLTRTTRRAGAAARLHALAHARVAGPTAWTPTSPGKIGGQPPALREQAHRGKDE